jgi:hypothetical protein
VYALSARRNIAGFSSDHINDVKELKAGKEDLEAEIAGEREREGEMLASESSLIAIDCVREILMDQRSSRKGTRCKVCHRRYLNYRIP